MQRVSDQSEDEGPDSSLALSMKRKATESEDDPVTATLNQLREELRQLRQERQDREREIAELALAPQIPRRESTPSVISPGKILENSPNVRDSRAIDAEILPESPKSPSRPVEPQGKTKPGKAPEKFTVTGGTGLTTTVSTLSPLIIIADDDEGEEVEATQRASGDGASEGDHAKNAARSPSAPSFPTARIASEPGDATLPRGIASYCGWLPGQR
jgi:hypothetical protein